ncbi:acyltransferase [Chitinibacter fontanus]|uniref:Acyltransferase n=1 Tax=Chitinibacter fontanus TaxID=1737446 RepID=A0A7D5V9S7_9NEIS|nr:acyltransferase [Chitinibacter fontanus]QLI80953.1 acyltransferase [Chitinibacter fontanus]
MSKTLPLLTALRGFAALMVFFFHARLLVFPQWKAPLAEYTQFFENGYLWVDLFFILSGLVLAHVYAHSFAASTISFRRFIWLRLTRIYPLFLLTMAVLVAWEGYKWAHQIGYFGGPLFNAWGMAGIPAFAGPFNQAEALWQNLLLVQVLAGKGLTWNVAAWSLSVEWFSYLAFPLLLLLVSGRYRAELLVVFALAALYAICRIKGNLDVTEGWLSILRGMASFTLGLALQRLLQNPRWAPWLNNDLALAVAFVVPLVLISFPQTAELTLALIVSFVVLIAVAAIQVPRNSWVFRSLENRWSQLIGDLSFSIYLWHAVVLLVGVEVAHLLAPVGLEQWYAQQNVVLSLLGVFGVLLLILLISAASYYAFERPVQARLRQYFFRPALKLALAK